MTQNYIQEIDGNHDFEWAFYLNRLYLDVAGVWPSDKKRSRLKSLWLPLLLITVLSSYCLPTTYAFIRVRHELRLVIDNLMTLIASWTTVSKIILLWYHTPVYQTLIKWAKSDWCRCTETWERQLMFKQARRGRILTTISYITMFFHATFYLVNPLFYLRLRIINNITDPDPQKVLPTPTYYPYEYYKSPKYELTYLSQVFSLWGAASVYSAVDNFFSVMVFHASGQCEIAAGRMCRLFDERGNRTTRDKVGELVEFHNYLVGFVHAIEESFSIILLIHISGSVLLICSVSYGCIKAVDDDSPVIQIVVLGLAFFNMNEHIFIYCLTAEILSSNSLEIFDGIYNSLWYEMPAKDARYIILIMTRPQYPLKLTAGKFFTLSLNSYIQIVKSTAGYISMLLTIT